MLFRKPSVQTEGLLYPLVRALVVDRSGVMSGPGAIFKRCSCRDAAGRPLNNKCPRLAKRGHRAWSFHASATNLPGRSERVRRGGWPPPERTAPPGPGRWSDGCGTGCPPVPQPADRLRRWPAQRGPTPRLSICGNTAFDPRRMDVQFARALFTCGRT